MASIQPTINKPTTTPVYKTLVYKSKNPYKILSNDEIKVKKEEEIKVKENQMNNTENKESPDPYDGCICAKYLADVGITEMVPSYKEPTAKEQLKFELGLNQECPKKAGLPSVQAKLANKTTQPRQVATVQATNHANHVQVTHLINHKITDKAEAGTILIHAAQAYVIHCMCHMPVADLHC